MSVAEAADKSDWRPIGVSPSTFKKEEWVLKNLRTFNKELPLTPQDLFNFVLFMGNAGYSTKTVSDVIIPGLKRAHRRKFGVPMSDEMKRAGIDGLHRIRLRFGSKVTKKDPAILEDVERIVSQIPPFNSEKKAEETAAILLCFQSGSRSITLVSIELRDIIAVIVSTALKTTIVQIAMRILKGDRNSTHVVSFEGMIGMESSTDSVYWLNKHLLLNHGVGLTSFPLDEDDEASHSKLFHWNSASAFSNMVSKRSYLCGFRDKQISAHSLRSGMVCSSILNAREGSDVMLQTALIGNWVQGSKAHRGYMSTMTKATMVCSRLVAGGSNPVVEKSLAEPHIFHQLKGSMKSRWDLQKLCLRELHSAISKKLKLQSNLRRQWSVGVRRYIKEHRLKTKLNMSKKQRVKEDLVKRILRGETMQSVVDDFTKDYIVERESDAEKSVEDEIEDGHRGGDELQDESEEEHSHIPIISSHMSSRVVNSWSNEETKMLAECIGDNGRDWDAAALMIRGRTWDSCKAKWTRLKRKFDDADDIDIASAVIAGDPYDEMRRKKRKCRDTYAEKEKEKKGDVGYERYEELKKKDEVPKLNKFMRSSKPQERDIDSKRNWRKRIPWSVEEMKALLDMVTDFGVHRYGVWANATNHPLLKLRNNSDVRDKWRNMSDRFRLSPEEVKEMMEDDRRRLVERRKTCEGNGKQGEREEKEEKVTRDPSYTSEDFVGIDEREGSEYEKEEEEELDSEEDGVISREEYEERARYHMGDKSYYSLVSSVNELLERSDDEQSEDDEENEQRERDIESERRTTTVRDEWERRDAENSDEYELRMDGDDDSVAEDMLRRRNEEDNPKPYS